MTCQCPHAGYCEHLGRHMPKAFWTLCQTERGYAMFSAEAKAGKYKYKVPVPHPNVSCRHRGDVVRTAQCKACGNRTKTVNVYHCGVHGECTLDVHGIGGTGGGPRPNVCKFCDDIETDHRGSAAQVVKFYQPDEPVIREWAVGITTAPREVPTLERCVRSVVNSGWPDPWIFAEPDTDLSGLPEAARVVQRPYRFGAWHNWREMCRQLLQQTTADAFLTIQDDALLAPHVRQFLERDLWPSPRTGFVFLYTPRHYSNGTPACHRFKTGCLWGVCAVVFPRKAMEQIVDHPIAKRWHGVDSQSPAETRESWQIANVDTAIGGIVNRLRLEMWAYTPALAQHVGTTSTLGHGGVGGRREAAEFVGTKITPEEIEAIFQGERLRYYSDGRPHESNRQTEQIAQPVNSD